MSHDERRSEPTQGNVDLAFWSGGRLHGHCHDVRANARTVGRSVFSNELIRARCGESPVPCQLVNAKDKLSRHADGSQAGPGQIVLLTQGMLRVRLEPGAAVDEDAEWKMTSGQVARNGDGQVRANANAQDERLAGE